MEVGAAMAADSAIAVAIPLIKHEKHRRIGRTTDRPSTATGRGRSLANQPESGTLSKTSSGREGLLPASAFRR